MAFLACEDARMASKKKVAEEPWVKEMAERFSAARDAAGLEKADLARLAEVDPSALSRLEKATRVPGVDILVRACRKLGITVEFLVDGVGPDGEMWDGLHRNLPGLLATLENSGFMAYANSAKTAPKVSDALLVAKRLRLEQERGVKSFTPSSGVDWEKFVADLRKNGVESGLGSKGRPATRKAVSAAIDAGRNHEKLSDK